MLRPLYRLACGLALLTLGPAFARADADPAAHAVVFNGALLMRLPGHDWQSLQPGDGIPAGAELISIPQAELVSADGDVKVLMLADIGKRTPFPVLETSFKVLPAGKSDFALELERGIVLLTNEKKQGPATVRVNFQKQHWHVTLKTPGTRVGIEIYGRHIPGLIKKIDDKAEPVINVVFVAAQGHAFLDLGDQGYALDAPPGTSLAIWDTYSQTPELHHLDKLPYRLLDLNAKEKEVFDQICSCGRALAKGKLPEAAEKLVSSATKSERLVSVVTLGALDDLPGLLDALADPNHDDVREEAVLALRNWIGRGAGQVARLHKALLAKDYTEAQARAVFQLLIGFTASERQDPTLYEVLLGYLDHSKPAVRELAHWHLVRLVQGGSTIPYDPTAPEAERRMALAAWRTLIPAGQVPSRSKKSSDESKESK